MFLIKTIVIVSALFCYGGLAKQYTRCEVTQILHRNGFDRSLLPTWVCLIDAGGRDTNKVTPYGSHSYYGLFQIQSMDYCTPGKRNGGGMCKNDCKNFINNDISDDMTCAKMIFNKHGFKTWPKFETSCKGNLVQPWVTDVKKCLHFTRNSPEEQSLVNSSPLPSLSRIFVSYRAAPKARFDQERY